MGQRRREGAGQSDAGQSDAGQASAGQASAGQASAGQAGEGQAGEGQASAERQDASRLDAGQPRCRRWRRVSCLGAVTLVVAAVAGATLAGWAWAGYQRAEDGADFHDTASSIASAIASTVQRDLDFSQSFGQLVASQETGLTNHQLARYFRGLNLPRRYPGTIGVSFYRVVTQSQLASYEATMASDPEPGESGGYAVYPAGTRGEYCLPRYGVLVKRYDLPIGLDICAATFPGLGPSPLAGLVHEATLSGRPVIFGFDSMKPVPANTERFAAIIKQFANQFLVITPVFTSSPAQPAGLSGPHSLAGWVVQTFGNAALDAALARTHGYDVTVTSTVGTVVTLGEPLHRGDVLVETTRVAGTSLMVTVRTRASTAPELQGIVVGSGVAAFLGLVVAFLLYLRRARRRALDLVDLRTGELRHQALHDALTGLPNRTLLFDRADQMLARSRRRSMSIAALYVDLDNFKEVNDTFGHQVGDQLLIEVGRRLRTVLRAGDTVGRLGGDEFLVLTEGETDADHDLMAARLVTVLRDPFDLPASQPLRLTVTASIGVAIGSRVNTMDLIRDADVALYQAKAAGRNRFAVFQKSMQTSIHDALTLEMDLRGALADEQLFLLYQPIVRLSDCAPIGVEALLRWRHPTRGVIPPLDFVPIAERSGLIVEIGRFVLRSACRQAAVWHADGLDLQMAVNVSAVQLEEPRFVSDLEAILRSTGLQASKLTLELTESVLVQDPTGTAQVLASLKEMGVRIAVDDFGTGYSSLAYLRQFPIDLLKIDRTFVARHGREDQWAAFLHTLIQLGRSLGIQTLAEGVEDQDQLVHLQREHCDSAQGFLFAKPLPAATVPARCAEAVAQGCAA